MDAARALRRANRLAHLRFLVPAAASIVALAFAAAPGRAPAAATTTADGAALERGAVELRSLSTLTFTGDGTLLLGDSLGAAVWAVDVGEGAAPGATAERAKFENAQDLDRKVAALLGVAPRDLVIEDLAVAPRSGNVYVAVSRGRGEEAQPVLLRMRPAGEVEPVALADVPRSRLSLGNQPAADAMMYRTPARTLTITDLELIDGEVWIAGLSNEEFASTLRRAKFPFASGAAATGLEIYHGAHGAFETFAPIYTFLPYEFDGKAHVIAAYLCTPLVTFSLDELRGKDKLRGKTIAELGFGNRPIDMISYEFEGERYVLMTNDRRGTMKFRARDLEEAQRVAGIEAPVEQLAGVPYTSSALGNVVEVADYDPENLLALVRSLDDGGLHLRLHPKRFV
jgi:hypothetical protein